MDQSQLKEDFQKCLEHLSSELSQLRTGRATTELLEPVKVEAYGAETQLKAVGNVSVSDAKSLVVQVWDKNIIEDVVKSIDTANLGLRCSIEGDLIRVSLPDMTEERRKDLVRVMKERVEASRIAVRQVRQKYMQEISEAVEGGLSQDDGEAREKVVEDETKAANEKIEEMRKKKEEDLMKV
ncbi:ribosome recycling factor [Candidatus Dojkabacteria bacterium]|uniref:Ribosome recycling factor n=1 Tax=Candidatus Dojkabacteria bacterium TaxID=2099670 RepID=A0A955I205_9BACT|nr:ribosome recycling factor [Candidatus Dojkabacteria bacterium]